MRTKSQMKESSVDALLLVGHQQPPELRKNEGHGVRSKARSKCSKEHKNGGSRSGSTTPRCLSQSPSPRYERGNTLKDGDGNSATTGTDTPRTYLIKDFLNEADTSVPSAVVPSVVPPVTSNVNRFLSDIEEVEWTYDGHRLVQPSPRNSEEDAEGIERFRDELRKLRGKGKAQGETFGDEVRDERRGKAPLAFPTEEVAGAPSEDYERVPSWFTDAYHSLAELDDDGTAVARVPELQEQGASSSSQGRSLNEPLVRKSEGFYTNENEGSDEEEPTTLGDRVRKVFFGEGDGDENKEVPEEDVGRGQQGPGWLWKASLCASVSFVTWVLANGAKIQCKSLLPTIRERDQPLKILRRKDSKKYHGSRE